MKDLAAPALEAVEKGEVQLIPSKFTATYRYWMEHVKDWCVSRQLWWGQQIPAWYDTQGDYVIAKTADEAVAMFRSEEHTSELKSLMRISYAVFCRKKKNK